MIGVLRIADTKKQYLTSTTSTMFAIRQGAALFRERTPQSVEGLRQAVELHGHERTLTVSDVIALDENVPDTFGGHHIVARHRDVCADGGSCFANRTV